ncbi:phage tail protein [Oxalobacter formigenes]|uniref:phage tail protein n=1 Tax=Oxalobacter formigenes TaxID=847 RepID=UPI0022AF7D24|nr:phage tail protein [Oxalobacter formigenes]WAW06773.1 phage tail protein [Oxalobacter formigenes]
MAINEFKPFAATADANVQDQADYEQSEIIRAGFRTGLARSAEVNKAIRQATSITAAVAEFTAEKSGKDMRDDGNIQTMKANFETALSAVFTLLVAQAKGESDVLTGKFTPEVKELKNGLMVHVRAKEKNLTKTPVFKADAMEAKTIVKGNNLALADGDIAGAGHWLEMQYDEALDKWVLMNPARGIMSQQSGVPVGTIEYFAMETPPAGYLKADGRAVSRETYPELFFAIGTTFGEGDGSMTFNLPDLIERFAQGGTTPGQKIEAGLPNIAGSLGSFRGVYSESNADKGALFSTRAGVDTWGGSGAGGRIEIKISADKSNPIYGKSNTVQPPALTLLPCIKAFDAATNPGLIDITGLANDVDGKLDKSVNGTAVKYITETFNDGTNWYRKWSDGWVEQGGSTMSGNVSTIHDKTYSFYIPFQDVNYSIFINQLTGAIGTVSNGMVIRKMNGNTFNVLYQPEAANLSYNWHACGMGVAS